MFVQYKVVLTMHNMKIVIQNCLLAEWFAISCLKLYQLGENSIPNQHFVKNVDYILFTYGARIWKINLNAI